MTLPTPSMIRYGSNSNAHWLMVFVEVQGGWRGVPDYRGGSKIYEFSSR